MSIQCSVICLDCSKSSPNLGDGGFLGAPMLAPVADVDMRGESMPSFGYFYEALNGLGIRPYDVDAFREFLQAHDGHRLVLTSDHGAISDYPEEVLALETREISEILADVRAEDARREQRTESGEFTHGIYSLTCLDCQKAHEAPEAELLASFEPFTVSADAVSMYLERWVEQHSDGGWNHRLMGMIDPYMPFVEELGGILHQHRKHPLEARVRADV